MKDYKFMTCVLCFTYNQNNYVIQALHSIVSQITKFPIVIILVDDASTDGTDIIVKDYVSKYFNLKDPIVAYEKETDYAYITYAQHKTNKNCFISAYYLKENHYQTGQANKKWDYISEWIKNSKYYTACEGDDWWTDDLKLQKLVSFLESNTKYVLACHRYNRYIQNEDRYENDSNYDIHFGKEKGITFGRYFNRFVNWRTQTLATIYNREIMEKSIDDYPYRTSDGIRSYFPLKYGKGYCFNEHMATYRVNDGGVYSGISQLERLYGNWLMYRDFNNYENSLFSKWSFYDMYFSVLKYTKWKGYKDAKPCFFMAMLSLVIVLHRISIILFYKFKNLFQK